MAADKLVDSAALDEALEDVADAIREKAEITGKLSFPQGFIDAISNLSTAPEITRTSNSAGGVTVTITAAAAAGS